MHIVYTPSLTQKQRRAHWQAIIADWRNSSLKRKTFCEQHHLKVTDLKRWDYRINQLNKKRLAATASLPPIARESDPSFSFVPVEMASSTDANVLNSLQLQHHSGFSVAITTQTDEHLIKKVIRLFTEATC